MQEYGSCLFQKGQPLLIRLELGILRSVIVLGADVVFVSRRKPNRPFRVELECPPCNHLQVQLLISAK